LTPTPPTAAISSVSATWKLSRGGEKKDGIDGPGRSGQQAQEHPAVQVINAARGLRRQMTAPQATSEPFPIPLQREVV
jgi:hypothetical protein